MIYHERPHFFRFLYDQSCAWVFDLISLVYAADYLHRANEDFTNFDSACVLLGHSDRCGGFSQALGYLLGRSASY